jgi:hypothetical protein
MVYKLGVDDNIITLTENDNWNDTIDNIFKFRLTGLKSAHSYVLSITATAHDKYFGNVLSYAIGDTITIKPLETPTVTP